MNCQEFRSQVDASLSRDKRLSRGCRYHASTCADCLRYSQRTEVLWDARRPDAHEPVPLSEVPPFTRIAFNIIQQAIVLGATQATITPVDDGLQVAFRINGAWRESMSVPSEMEVPLIARLKLMADLDVHCDDRRQEGKIRIRYQDKDYQVPMTTVPNGPRERVLMRIERG